VIVKVQDSAKECNRVRQHTALFLARSAVRNAVWAPKIFCDFPTPKCVTAQTLAVKTTTNSEIQALCIGVTVEEFGRMIRMSERSAWTVIRQEADKAAREGRQSALPLISPIEGGHMRRLRIGDIQKWWAGLT
jgi:hypothetical protein